MTRYTVVCVVLDRRTDGPGLLVRSALAVVDTDTVTRAAHDGCDAVARALPDGYGVTAAAVLVGSHPDAMHAFAPDSHLGTLSIARWERGKPAPEDL